jgi:flagellar hook-length control protein FliK
MEVNLSLANNIMPSNSGNGQATPKARSSEKSSKFSLELQEQTTPENDKTQHFPANPVEKATTDNNTKEVSEKPISRDSEKGDDNQTVNKDPQNDSVQNPNGDKVNVNPAQATPLQNPMPAEAVENITEATTEEGQGELLTTEALIKLTAEIAGAISTNPALNKTQTVVKENGQKIIPRNQADNKNPLIETGDNTGDNKVLPVPPKNQQSAAEQQTTNVQTAIQNQQTGKGEDLPEEIIKGETIKTEKPNLSSPKTIDAQTEQITNPTENDKPTEEAPKEQKTIAADSAAKQNITKPAEINAAGADTQNSQAPLTEKIYNKSFDTAQTAPDTKQGGKENGANTRDSSQFADIQTIAANETKTQNTDVANTMVSSQKAQQYSGTSVNEQVSESIQSSLQQGVNQITIRLNPPELGAVSIKFEQKSDGITGLLNVSRPETRQEIQQALPTIIKNLADAGISIKKLDVVLDQPEQQSYANSQSGNQNLYHNPYPNNAEPIYNNPMNYQLPQQFNGYILPEYEHIQVSDESINMLA